MSEKNKINSDKLVEVHTRLHTSTTRLINTEDISYLTELPREYVNEQIEKSIEVLKNGGNDCAKYITKFNDKYSLLPLGSFMVYLAGTQMDDGTEDLETFVNVLLLLIHMQMSVDDFIINKLHKEEVFDFDDAWFENNN